MVSGLLAALVERQLSRDLGQLVPVPGLTLVLLTDGRREGWQVGLGEGVLVVPDVSGGDVVRKADLTDIAALEELDDGGFVGGQLDVVLVDLRREIQE